MRFDKLNESFNSRYGITEDIDEYEENLEEGILDLAKSKINDTRAAINNRRADKAYTRGDMTAGKSARDKANKYSADAALNRSRHNNKGNLVNTARDKSAVARELERKSAEALDEYTGRYNSYLESAKEEFKKCNSRKELSKTYEIYADELKAASNGTLEDDNPALVALREIYDLYSGAMSNYGSFRNAYADDTRRDVEKEYPRSEYSQPDKSDSKQEPVAPSANYNDEEGNKEIKGLTSTDLETAFNNMLSSGAMDDIPVRASSKLYDAFLHELNSVLYNKTSHNKE